MGGLLAEATGSDFKTGAAAAGLNEALINQLAWAARGNDDITLMLSQLTGLLAAAAVDGDLEKGSEIAQKASTYNWLTHREIEDADKARAGCSALGAGAGACEKKIIRDMDELDKSRNLGMFDLERSLQLSVLRDGMTQGEYREALLDGFNGLDPRDLVFTGYAPANELGYRAEALGSHVVDLAAEFPGRFKAGLEGLINNYDQIPAGIAQSARDGVDWWTGPIPAQAIARAEDKLVFSTPEQLGDRLFDMTLGTAAGAAGGLVGGKAIEWFAGRWATRAGAEGVGAKGLDTGKAPYTSTVSPDAEAGMPYAHPVQEAGAKGGALVTKGSDVTPETIQKALSGDKTISAQDGVSLPMIQRYVDRLLNGDVAPPIKMDGDVIVDGNHRYIASKILGREPTVDPGVLTDYKASKKRPTVNLEISPLDWDNR
ncbi:ParB N-terminal domain-containing protein [Pseudomonas yamanorum]